MTTHEEAVMVYADGSCLGNPGPGGWAVLIVEPGGTREFSGGEPSTTNNRMEITAAIEALGRIEPGAQVILRSDSQYLVKTMNESWKRKLNRDLWEKLDAQVGRHRVKFEWVASHGVDPMNDRADRLANEAARAVANGRLEPGVVLSAAIPTEPGGCAQDRRRAERTPAADAENEIAPMLHQGEVVRRCAGCGRLFVADTKAGQAGSYCSLVACQLKARLPRA